MHACLHAHSMRLCTISLEYSVYTTHKNVSQPEILPCSKRYSVIVMLAKLHPKPDQPQSIASRFGRFGPAAYL